MTGLQMWLKRATRSLSAESASLVCAEIEEHFAASREAAMQAGANAADAERAALAVLGDAGAANRQYRRVLLTEGEARFLRTRGWDVDAEFCGWLRWFVLFWAAVAASTGIWSLIAGRASLTLILLGSAAALSIVALPMFVSICTPERSRIYRWARWALMLGSFAIMLLFVFKKPTTAWVVLFPSLWLMLRTEWTRISIRRKMPVDRWPKHLYL